MEEKKTSTADILAKIRAQKAAEAVSTTGETPAAELPAAAAQAHVAAAPAAKPTSPPGTKATSTGDIMAAIRGGAKPVAPMATAPEVAVPEVAVPEVAVQPISPQASIPSQGGLGPKLSPAEMLAKMREAKASGSIATPASTVVVKPTTTVAAPPMPAKPVVASKAKVPATRRGMAGFTTVACFSATCFILGFLLGSNLLIALGALAWTALLTPFMAAWAAIASVGGIWTLGTARFMFPNVLVEPPSKFKVGPLSDYPLNTVSNKWKDQFGIWVVHTDQYEGRNMIYALATVCTHLGCTPNWLDGEQKFKCPCHGSGFYITGVNFEGPAPRPLERMGLRIAEDGMLEVNKSVKFQEEMGQWADATSYVEVV